MTYLSDCIADSPSMLYPMSTYSSGYADSSGNTRNLDVLSGTAPASTATAPDGANAAAWGSSAGFLRTTYTQSGPTVGTFEFWFRYAAAPTANLILATWCPNSGSFGGEPYVALLTTGKLSFAVNAGATSVDSPAALSINSWHHVVCSWGAGGMTLRVDKSTLGTGANTSAVARTASFRLHGYWSGGADILQTGAVDMAWAAFYPTQLTNTRTDSHYDAMMAAAGTATSGTASLSLSASGGAAGSSAGSASLSLSASGASGATAAGTASLSLSATGDTTPPAVASGTASLSLSASGAAGAGVAGTAALDLSASGAATGATAATGSASLSLSALGSATLAAAGTAHLDLAAAGSAAALYVTDTSNSNNGRTRGGRATVTVTRPVAAVPPGTTFGERYDKALALPEPVMVDGRPT